MYLDEAVYYPVNDEGSSLEGIKIADGQHLVESKFDKVFSGGTMQQEIFKFVKDSV